MVNSKPKLPPLSLYVHVPWCVKKCPYCDFNSHESQDIPEQAYLETLLRDFDGDQAFIQNRDIATIFIGGGTPSLMSGAFYQKLLTQLQDRVRFQDDIEITLEANPGTTEASRFEDYQHAGVNRLSMGVQSFQNRQLELLGRIHSSQDARSAFRQAREAGFDNINLDLMHGLPEQNQHMAMDDLGEAIDLGPEHLSWYQLTIEKNTAFYTNTPILPEEDILWDIQEAGFKKLVDAGYQQYEISAFARHKRRARHNLNYWEFGDYIGIGAGAHSKVTLINDDLEVMRYRKSRAPKDYLKPKPYFRVGEERIKSSDLPFEFMMNVLRLNDGVEESRFQERTGLDICHISEAIAMLRRQGLLVKDRLQATEKGHLFLNTVLESFSSI